MLGWCLSAFGIGQLIIWAIIAVYKSPEPRLYDRFKSAFKPSKQWGPLDPALLKVYQQTVTDANTAQSLGAAKSGLWFKIYDNIFNWIYIYIYIYI